jgi:hexosaminidase
MHVQLNVLHWHIVDYQSWPIQSLVYPDLWSAAWSPSERYTLSDAAAVVNFARQRGVLVVPEFDTPGHADAVCTGYPEACPAPECTTPLNPATNFTFELIEGVLNEWSQVFTSQYMHLGGDEVSTDCWSSTPAIASWMQENGFTPDQTYEYFVVQTDKIANTLGRDAVRWEEVWNHFGTSLPPNTIIHVWLDHPTLANVTSNGYYGILSDNDVYYLDHLTLTWQNFYDNDLLLNIGAKAEPFVLGGETCMWGETADPSDVLQTIAPRYAAAAERQWSYNVVTNSTDPTVQPRLADFRCLLLSRGIPAAPLNNAQAREAPSGPGSCQWQ